MVRPIDDALVLVVGAQRSGTTWVQRLLASHPRVVSGQESHLFSGYLGLLWQRWQREALQRAQGGRTVGLACYLDEAELLEEMRGLARRVLGRLWEWKPGADRILEKTPDHGLVLPLVARLFPATRVLHVVRDGRDVAVSLKEVGRTPWGRSWAPATAGEAAERWATWVRTIERDRGLFERGARVRYEDLAADPAGKLGELYAFLDLELPEAEVRAITERLSFERSREGAGPEPLLVGGEAGAASGAPRGLVEPEGFLRRGEVGGWRRSLSLEERHEVHARAGELLAELGYPAEPPPPLPLGLRLRRWARKLRGRPGATGRGAR